MDAGTLRNVARNALRPSYLPVMARKVAARLRPAHRDEALRWAAAAAEPVAHFATPLDPGLWAEAEAWAADFEPRARARLASLGVTLGGGGHHQLLYFLVRLLRPATVLETGVAAGWTSEAILAALAANGEGGVLWSSDFPYFRLESPEQYVGCVVDDELRDGWHLGLKGDRANFAEFLPQIDRIDLFHFDSDKSMEGRAFAMDAVAPKLAPNAVVVMDDIDDNTYFRDYAARDGRVPHVFERGGKYVGLLGLDPPP